MWDTSNLLKWHNSIRRHGWATPGRNIGLLMSGWAILPVSCSAVSGLEVVIQSHINICFHILATRNSWALSEKQERQPRHFVLKGLWEIKKVDLSYCRLDRMQTQKTKKGAVVASAGPPREGEGTEQRKSGGGGGKRRGGWRTGRQCDGGDGTFI